jgi:aminoglycoside phosphotransferase (APT) family kinase protein
VTEPSPLPEPSAATLAWVREHTGGGVIRGVESLAMRPGHSVHALTLDRADLHHVVLRLRASSGLGDPDPDLTVEREAAALTMLERAGFDAPRLLALDACGDRSETPALLMTRLPGRVMDDPDALDDAALDQLARAALTLHHIPSPWPGIPAYTPYHRLTDPRPPSHATRPDLWTRAFAEVASGPPSSREVFVHRDYHPGNTLWSHGRLTGVIDWMTASRGPAGVDLGHMRWNLVLEAGEPVADAFLERYRALGGSIERQPYWDLRTVIDLLADDDPAAEMVARLEPYVSRALDRG